MPNTIPAIVRISLTAACIAAPKAMAGAGTMLEERYHAALSEMSQEVRQAPDPGGKRRILSEFLEGMQKGLRKAETLSSLPEEDRKSLHMVLGKYSAYRAELDGTGGYARVPDRSLDAFASYIRQDMEQAPVGGGVYISGGVLLVLLVLLILVL